MAANLHLVWTKTDASYEAKSSYGHYRAIRTKGDKFMFYDGENLVIERRLLLREVKEYAQVEDNMKHESAEKEARDRDLEAMADATREEANHVVQEELESEEWVEHSLNDYATPTTSREEIDRQDEDTFDSSPEVPMSREEFDSIVENVISRDEEDHTKTGYIECQACSLASGADRGVYHEPPECPLNAEDKARIDARTIEYDSSQGATFSDVMDESELGEYLHPETTGDRLLHEERDISAARKKGESFEDWKKRCFGIETLKEFKDRATVVMVAMLLGNTLCSLSRNLL
jgi:hypothetical protein